jgi:hypothetical protein
MTKYLAAMLVTAIALGISSAHAQNKFFVGTTTELKEFRAVADAIRYENGSPYANPPSGPGVYCLGFWGQWYCSPMQASCWAPPYTGSCGAVSMFGGAIQVPIGHAWGPHTGEFTAGLPGPLDFVEVSPAAIAAYEGQTRTIDGDEVTVPMGVTFDELPVPAQNAIVEHVCTGHAEARCQAGVLYCCE